MLADSNVSQFTVKDIAPSTFIKAYAEYLKKNDKVKLPKWMDLVKTGKSRELSPTDPDWLYVRIAAVARKVYLRQHIGVGTMKHMFGQKQRNGVANPHHATAGGKIIRYALQQLEGLGIVKKDKKSVEKRMARVITTDGQKELNVIATQVGKRVYAKGGAQ